MRFRVRRRIGDGITRLNLLRFSFRRMVLGFEYANILLGRIDRRSIVLILKRNGASIGKECDIESGLTFHNCKNYSNLVIGDYSHIGKNCFFDLRNKVIIENNVTVSMECRFITHTDVGKSQISSKLPPVDSPILVESHSYLGAGVTVLMGVRIGKAAVVGAGALVNRDVPSNLVVAGIPAREIRKI